MDRFFGEYISLIKIKGLAYTFTFLRPRKSHNVHLLSENPCIAQILSAIPIIELVILW